MKHLCHAENCDIEVPPKMLMCQKHWRKVPEDIQSMIWHHYRPGQEIDKNPTKEYLDWMQKAIDSVKEKGVVKCLAKNPKNPKQVCERFGKCGKSRRHIAVDRSGQGKADLIEFYTEDQTGFQTDEPVELPRQGSLF